MLRFYENLKLELETVSQYYQEALTARHRNSSNSALLPQTSAPVFSVFSPHSFSNPSTRSFMLHFRESLHQLLVLANFFERWCSQQSLLTWAQIGALQVSQFALWLCAEAAFFVSSTDSQGEYGIMRGLWANVLQKTSSVTSDTSGSCTLSPFSNGIPDSGPSCVSIICPTFGLEDDARAGRQYSLVLRDLVPQLDKHPDRRHFFWFPTDLSPEDLWCTHFPRLSSFAFRKVLHQAKSSSVFMNCPKSQCQSLSLWSLAPPQLEPGLPRIPPYSRSGPYRRKHTPTLLCPPPPSPTPHMKHHSRLYGNGSVRCGVTVLRQNRTLGDT